jgi:hypothetical protein
MAIEQKEVYIIELEDGRKVNAVCASYEECLKLFGEENIVEIRKIGKADVEA